MILRAKSQRGDTIVEVLLAVAVVSSVLGIAYAIMNRNLQTIRSNQERTEATRLAQGQIEALKAVWGGIHQDKLDNTIQNSGFCIIAGVPTDPLSNVPVIGGVDNFTDYASCIGSSFSSNELYHVALKRQAANIYKVFVRWDSLTSSERNEVTLTYRLQ